LHLTIKPEAGGAGQTVDVTLQLGANNRFFSGDGTVLGRAVHFDGRLDVPDDDKEQMLRGVRLVCRFHTTDPQPVRYASVVGYIPALADTPDRIDSENGNGNGKGNGNGNGNKDD
jgi:hypothetical protein